MEEETKRPFSRKRSETTAHGGVNVQNEKGQGHAIGNRVNERENNDIDKSSLSKRPLRKKGFAFLPLLLIWFIAIFNNSSFSSLFNGKEEATQNPIVQFQKPSTFYETINHEEVNFSSNEKARKKFTEIIGDGKDSVTVMVYITATDLESRYGMATADINEMIYALSSDNVNVVLQVGGNRQWQNSAMRAGRIQRWRLAKADEGRGIIALDENVGSDAMTDPDTLVDFIEYASEEFPANRNILILWDHGGGSLQGYGYDEYYPNTVMTLDEISYALKKADKKFDIIGFDACLMATVETAVTVEPYADYLIASEEVEPGEGWYYTDWLTALARNTSLPSLEIAKNIVDSYMEKGKINQELSLSVVDLADFAETVPAKLSAFSKNVHHAIQENRYQELANARYVAKEFAADTKIDQIDLIHFAKNIGDVSSQELVSALESSIKYNRTKNIRNAHGLSIFFPYYAPKNVQKAVGIYEAIGMDADYTNAIRNFVAVEGGGQILHQQQGNSVFNLLQGENTSSGNLNSQGILQLLSGSDSLQEYTGEGFVADSLLNFVSSFLSQRSLTGKNLSLSNRHGKRVLKLDNNDWSTIQDITLNVWVKDEEGYIDLGFDNVFDFDDEGNLLAQYDGKWISLNNRLVSYYYVSEEVNSQDDYLIRGYVPALLNDEFVHILLEFSDEIPEGLVIGARKVYDEQVEAKGFVPMKEGDSLIFLADYYDNKGRFFDSYPLGESYIIEDAYPEDEEKILKVGTYQIVGEEGLFSYRLSDIYQAIHYTEMTAWK